MRSCFCSGSKKTIWAFFIHLKRLCDKISHVSGEQGIRPLFAEGGKRIITERSGMK